MIRYAPIFIDGRWIVGIVGDDEPRIMTEEEVEDACAILNGEEDEVES